MRSLDYSAFPKINQSGHRIHILPADMIGWYYPHLTATGGAVRKTKMHTTHESVAVEIQTADG